MKAKPVFLFTALAGATGLALISLASSSDALAATKRYTRTFTVDAVGFLPDPKPVVVSVPTMGVIELLGCFGPPEYSMRTRALSFEETTEAQAYWFTGTATGSDTPAGVNPAGVVSEQAAGALALGGGAPLITQSGMGAGATGSAGHWEWSMWRNNGTNKRGAYVSIDGWNNPGDGKCRFSATVLQND